MPFGFHPFLEDNSSPLEAIIDSGIMHDGIALMLFKYVYNRLKMYLYSQLLTRKWEYQ